MSMEMIKEYITAPFVGYRMVRENKGVVCEKYNYGSSFGQYYLYIPPKGKPKDTIVVYIHGGGWKRGVPSLYKCVAKRFAERGYHTLSLGYRLAPLNKYPCQGEDVAEAYKEGMLMLKDKGINTEKVVVIGASAGGHLGGVLVYDKELQKNYGIKSEDIKGFVSLGGILKFDIPNGDYAKRLLNKLFTKGYDRTIAEPYTHIDGSEKNKVLCIHSIYDPISGYDNSKLFVEKVNGYNEGQGECYLINDKKVLHTNLVSGMFLEKGPAVKEIKVLYDWLGKL